MQLYFNKKKKKKIKCNYLIRIRYAPEIDTNLEVSYLKNVLLRDKIIDYYWREITCINYELDKNYKPEY